MMTRKPCPRCREEDPGMFSSERSWYCRRCNAQNLREWRQAHPERAREINETSNSKPESKAKRAEYQRKRQNTRAYRVRRMVHLAVKTGKLIKPECCEVCGSKPGKPRNLHGHHHLGYSHPLEVIWCCTRCHSELDRQRASQLAETPPPTLLSTDAIIAEIEGLVTEVSAHV